MKEQITVTYFLAKLRHTPSQAALTNPTENSLAKKWKSSQLKRGWRPLERLACAPTIRYSDTYTDQDGSPRKEREGGKEIYYKLINLKNTPIKKPPARSLITYPHENHVPNEKHEKRGYVEFLLEEWKIFTGMLFLVSEESTHTYTEFVPIKRYWGMMLRETTTHSHSLRVN